MSSGRSVVLGEANARIEDNDAVVVGSSRYVNGTGRKFVSHYYSMGAGMVTSMLSAAEAHTAKGNVGDEEAEEGGKR